MNGHGGIAALALPTGLVPYLLVGATGTAVHYGLLFLLVRSGLLAPLAASTCGAAAGATVIYLLNYHLTFRSTKSHLKTLVRFLLVAAVGMLFNAAILGLTMSRLEWPLATAQILATGVQFFAAFTANREWTF